MASIQQAAKWMREGRKVRRNDWDDLNPNWFADWDESVEVDGRTERPSTAFLELVDILADDWEIA